MLNESAVFPENIVRTGISPGKPLLQLRFGHATASVPGKNNEDFHGFVTPREDREAQTRGIAVAIDPKAANEVPSTKGSLGG